MAQVLYPLMRTTEELQYYNYSEDAILCQFSAGGAREGNLAIFPISRDHGCTILAEEHMCGHAQKVATRQPKYANMTEANIFELSTESAAVTVPWFVPDSFWPGHLQR